MKPVQDVNKEKVPVARIDPSFNKFEDVILFPEQLWKANSLLEKATMPKTKSRRRK